MFCSLLASQNRWVITGLVWASTLYCLDGQQRRAPNSQLATVMRTDTSSTIVQDCSAMPRSKDIGRTVISLAVNEFCPRAT
jgi:hypothetical protein